MKLDIKGFVGACALTLKKHGPEILVVSGVAGMIGSAVLACVATTKAGEIAEKTKKKADRIHMKAETSVPVDENEEAGLAVQKETRKELTRVYFCAGIDYAKLYGPSVALGALSVTGILAGHNLLRKRHVALAAAYTAIDASYRQYRGRVVERYGSDVDRELRHGLKREKIEETIVDESGREKKVKREVAVAENAPSDYARYFCYGEARAAEPNDDYNAFFLRTQQNIANDMLRANGYLFLNDVYDMLGIDRSIAGQAVGWVYDKNAEDHGDNYVDFGIQEVCLRQSDAPGDYKKAYLLDFNVDGSILDHSLDKGLLTK